MRVQNQITVYGERNRKPYTGFVYIWKKTQETRLKLSKSKQGRRWYTNGNETKLSFSSPGDGWREGRK